jgi:nicotinate phosphoribosyltransferase
MTDLMPSPALLTDQYELTMVQAALRGGTADTRCVFEVFSRSLPRGRRYGVVAGLGRLLELIERFRFDEGQIAWLQAAGVVDEPTAGWLASYRFSGCIDGYAEGEVYHPHSPVLTVEGSFAECTVLETLILSVLNHDSAIATAAARMVGAAGNRPCIEMGSRRTQEDAAVAAARAAWIAGFASSSNLEAGRRWGVPTAGTAAHSFVLVHPDEQSAFTHQTEALGKATTLLVDTYDVERAIRTAVEVAGPDLGAVRLDSGDLGSLAHRVRALLDSLGATSTRIVVSGDLDEFGLAALSSAPVDGYGVGTSVVVGSGVPTAGFVYKLVAVGGDGGGAGDGEGGGGRGWRPVQKDSPGKRSFGGRKTAVRLYDDAEVAEVELVTVGDPPGQGRRLQQRWVSDGRLAVGADELSTAAARERCRASVAELPPDASKLSPGEPVLDVRLEGPPA